MLGRVESSIIFEFWRSAIIEMMMATELRIKEAMIPKRSMQSDTVSVRPKSTIKNLQLYVLGSGGSLYGKYNAMEIWKQAYKNAEGG